MQNGKWPIGLGSAVWSSVQLREARGRVGKRRERERAPSYNNTGLRSLDIRRPANEPLMASKPVGLMEAVKANQVGENPTEIPRKLESNRSHCRFPDAPTDHSHLIEETAPGLQPDQISWVRLGRGGRNTCGPNAVRSPGARCYPVSTRKEGKSDPAQP